MARVPLDALVLDIHQLGLGPAAGFLAGTLEPPPAKAVAGALRSLRAIGALAEVDERLTPLGASSFSSQTSAFNLPSNRHSSARDKEFIVMWRESCARVRLLRRTSASSPVIQQAAAD